MSLFIGQSRGFGFARFSTIALAKRFLENYFPSLRMFPDGTRVKVAFSKTGGGGGENRDRGRRGRDGEDEWTCRVVCRVFYAYFGMGGQKQAADG